MLTPSSSTGLPLKSCDTHYFPCVNGKIFSFFILLMLSSIVYFLTMQIPIKCLVGQKRFLYISSYTWSFYDIFSIFSLPMLMFLNSNGRSFLYFILEFLFKAKYSKIWFSFNDNDAESGNWIWLSDVYDNFSDRSYILNSCGFLKYCSFFIVNFILCVSFFSFKWPTNIV